MTTPGPQTPLSRLLTLRAGSRVPGAVASSEILEDFLTLAHAPDHLAGVYKVARNTLELLELARTTPDIEEDLRERLRTYEIEVRWLKSVIRKAAKRLSGVPSQRKRLLKRSGKNPTIRRGALQHGLWCLLWHDHRNPGPAAGFRYLQLRALLAQMAILRYWTGRDEWRPRCRPRTTVLRGLYRETLAIRNFVMLDHLAQYDDILLHFPSSGILDGLMAALKSVASRHAPELNQNPSSLFAGMCSILWLLNRQEHPERVREISDADRKLILHPGGDTPPPPSGEGETYVLERSPVDDEPEDLGNAEEEVEPEHQEVEIDTYPRHQWTEQQMRECAEIALHPAEVLPTGSLRLSQRKSAHAAA